MTLHKPVFEQIKKAKHQKYGRDETMGIPRDVMLQRDFRGDEDALAASVRRGSVLVWQQDGIEFAGYRQTVAGVGKTIEDTSKSRSGPKEISEETYFALDKAIRGMSFVFDQDEQGPPQAITSQASSSKAEPAVLHELTEGMKTTLQDAKGAMERLYNGAMKMMSKCSQAKDKESFKPHMIAMKSWMDADDHLLTWLEFPDQSRGELTAASLKQFMCDHAEKAVALNEECEKFKALLRTRKEL